MSRRRFFVPEIRRGAAEITGVEAEHLVRVLRAEAGQQYEISDNRDVYLAEITSARKSGVAFQILEKLPTAAQRATVHVAAALIKFDRFEWIVEKATELGAASILAFEATRSEKGLRQAAPKRKSRWEKIALEASQQSRRSHLPRVETVPRLQDVLKLPARYRYWLDEDAAAEPIFRALPEERTDTDELLIIIGPEGGWTDEERVQASGAGIRSCSLGHNVLRAETAAVAALAIIQAAWAR